MPPRHRSTRTSRGIETRPETADPSAGILGRVTESPRSGVADDDAPQITSFERPAPERPGRWEPYRLPRNTVVRKALIDQLCADRDARVVTVTAPAGYGKTTLLAQWVEQDPRCSAWLSIDQFDNDPMVLLNGIRTAMVKAGMMPGHERALAGITSRNAFPNGVTRVIRDTESSTDALLVLDGAERLQNPESLAIVRELVEQLPENVVLAVASRIDIGLPSADLRARGALVEFSGDDLAFSRTEVADVCSQASVAITEGDIDELLARTEGWPIAVHLKMLDIQDDGPPVEGLHVCGDDETLACYIRETVLVRLSPAHVSFLTRTSILENLSGDLCSFVLEDPEAQDALESLASSTRLVAPFDQHRTWYRCHRLLREHLAADLHRREPDLESVLHSRAATWYQAHGHADRAVSHAMHASNEDLVSRLVLASARQRFAAGEIDTVTGWLEWFRDDDRATRYPGIAPIAAIAYCNIGDPGRARHWMAVATAMSAELGAMKPLFNLARAMMCPQSIDQTLADAIAAREEFTAASEWYAAATAIAAIATLWKGEIDDADALFASAAEAGERYDAAPAAVLAYAVRSRLANDRGDRTGAEAFAERALRLVREHRLERVAPSVLPFVTAARGATRRGDPAGATRLLAQATALRPALSVATPIVSVHTLLEMAEAEAELANIGGARQVLREASDIVRQCRSLGPLEARLNEMKERIATAPLGGAGVATLTNAELRLLPLLATHLSFPQIGERLYVSRHTIKSQAMSIYRKLDASSRSEAVQIARRRYLLSDD